MQDIAGIRMMCQFVDDIKQVVELLRNRNDFEIVEERDYISHQKNSGYRSYHIRHLLSSSNNKWRKKDFSRNSNSYISHEFLGND